MIAAFTGVPTSASSAASVAVRGGEIDPDFRFVGGEVCGVGRVHHQRRDAGEGAKIDAEKLAFAMLGAAANMKARIVCCGANKRAAHAAACAGDGNGKRHDRACEPHR